MNPTISNRPIKGDPPSVYTPVTLPFIPEDPSARTTTNPYLAVVHLVSAGYVKDESAVHECQARLLAIGLEVHLLPDNVFGMEATP